MSKKRLSSDIGKSKYAKIILFLCRNVIKTFFYDLSHLD